MLEFVRKNSWNLLFLLSLFFFVSNSIFYIFYSNSTFDEGNLLYKSYLYLSGKEIMYAPGGTWTEYMPGRYLFYGLSQVMFGLSFYWARFVSFVFGLLTFIITYLFVRRWLGKIEASIAVALIAINAPMVQSYSLVAGYSITSFFLICSLYIYLISKARINYLLMSILIFSLSFFVRGTLIFSYIMFILVCLYVLKGNKFFQKIVILFSSLVILLQMVPFFPEILRIFINYPYIKNIAVSLGYPSAYFSSYRLGVNIGKIFMSFFEFIKYYQMWFIPLFSLFLVLIFSANKRGVRYYFNKLFKSENYLLVLVSMLFIGNVIVHFIGSQGHCPRCIIPYFNFFSVLGSVLIAAMIGALIKFSKESYFSNFIFVVSTVVVIFVGSATLSNIFIRPFDKTSLVVIKENSKIIKENTKENSTIFSLVLPHYLYLSQREGFGPLINMLYSLRSSDDVATLKNGGLWNREIAKEWIKNNSDYILLYNNYYDLLSASDINTANEIRGKIEENYHVKMTIKDEWSGDIQLYEKNVRK